MTDPSLADKLHAARKAKGLTQDDVAGALHTDRVVVGKWERGVSVPRRRTLAALETLYGVPKGSFDVAPNGAKASKAPKATEATPPTRAQVRENGPPSGPPYAPVSVRQLDYWRGRFDTMADWAHALDGLIQQQREQFARFTRGVTEFRESGLLPGPNGAGPSPENGGGPTTPQTRPSPPYLTKDQIQKPKRDEDAG